jgi:hypothetical protein
VWVTDGRPPTPLSENRNGSHATGHSHCHIQGSVSLRATTDEIAGPVRRYDDTIQFKSLQPSVLPSLVK